MQGTESQDRLGIEENEAERIANFRGLLELLELERRLFAKANVPEGTQQAFGLLLKRLNRYSTTDILALYDRAQSKSKKLLGEVVPSDEELNSMSLEQIEKVVADVAASRKLLEAIAVKRFHYPKGSLRSLANIQSLKEKITTRVRNERAHRVISSAAQRPKH